MDAHGKKEIDKRCCVGSGGKSETAICCCTFCRTKITTSPCDGLDKTVLRNLFMSLQLTKDLDDLEAMVKTGLPVCAKCRDKVVMLSCNFQLYVQARESFEVIRNELAFSTIQSTALEPLSHTPMDGIRQRIRERWMALYRMTFPESKVYDGSS